MCEQVRSTVRTATAAAERGDDMYNARAGASFSSRAPTLPAADARALGRGRVGCALVLSVVVVVVVVVVAAVVGVALVTFCLFDFV